MAFKELAISISFAPVIFCTSSKIPLWLPCGVARFEKLLCENYKYSPEFIIEKAREEFYAFSGKKEYSDDIMMVMLKNNN